MQIVERSNSLEIEILENFHFRTTPEEWLKWYNKPIKAGEILSREWSYRRDCYDFLDGGRLLTILQLNRIKRECKALGYDVEYTIHKTVSKGTGWKKRRYYGKITIWFTVKGTHPKTAYEREQENLQAIMNGEGFKSVLEAVKLYLSWEEDSKIHLELDSAKPTSFYFDKERNITQKFACNVIVTRSSVLLEEYKIIDEIDYTQLICTYKQFGFSDVKDQELADFAKALALSLEQYSDSEIDKWEVEKPINAENIKFLKANSSYGYGWSRYKVYPIAKKAPVNPKHTIESETLLPNMW